VIIPDHSPQMSCAAPWHAGMAHTIGFMLATKAVLESPHGHDREMESATSGNR
jgi:mannonate dehydratase